MRRTVNDDVGEAIRRSESPPDESSRYTYHGATDYGQRRKERHLSRMLDAMLPELDNGARVAEIGPGRGELGRILTSRGLDYVAIEPSGELYFSLRAEGMTVIQAEVPPLPLGDESCDLIISVDVFEHFQSYRDAMGVCREALRSLKPGGWLAIVAPNYDTLGPLLFNLYEYQHAFPTNRCRLESLLGDAGFEVSKSTAFLTPLGFTRLWPLDRVLTHAALFFVRNGVFIGFLRGLKLETFLFRLHKNLCDHVAVVGRKATP